MNLSEGCFQRAQQNVVSAEAIKQTIVTAFHDELERVYCVVGHPNKTRSIDGVDKSIRYDVHVVDLSGGEEVELTAVVSPVYYQTIKLKAVLRAEDNGLIAVRCRVDETNFSGRTLVNGNLCDTSLCRLEDIPTLVSKHIHDWMLTKAQKSALSTPPDTQETFQRDPQFIRPRIVGGQIFTFC